MCCQTASQSHCFVAGALLDNCHHAGVITKLACDLFADSDGWPPGTLKAALRSRSACLTEQDYVNLFEQGFDSPEALLDARDKSLEAILVRQGAVDAVLVWQAESKPKQQLGK